ncbi:LysR family transcriptional regulator [Psychromonas sp. MB-3u-54]|uniref:LysR family transcriptional regulator n=1 Tax=Psychromonas sp. MB-3u-54 TaxID=2058319 RepID=UPI000C32D168|nr:LysR family transcriptional regulator [Psychromonas sp. MB-3u-54]PKH04391.1 LysR family transcriptional regulator [Psychromonas sp. MB-3u-54]
MINPLWLNTFKTLIEVGHFTQTAEKLNMTQPGVSQHIKKLENACSHSLIRREKKGFELTEQGKMVYEYALKFAEDEAKLIENLSFDNPYSGQCTLSCSGSLALLIYPKLLLLQQRYPDLSIHLEAAPNQKILSEVQSGNIDLGIVTHIPNGSFYQSEIIGRETLCLLLPKAYQNKKITSELLFNCGLIDHPDAMHYLSLYFDLCGEKELANINLNALPTSSYINQLNQILLPVAKGLGFTVLPESAVENFSQKKSLYIVKTAKKVEETLYLVQKRNRNLAHRYHSIYRLLHSVLK